MSILVFLSASVAAVLTFRNMDPPSTSFIVQARVGAWLRNEPLRVRNEWRDLDAISTHAAMAVVAAEDQLFPYHNGFDYKSIRRAMRSNDQGGTTRGASTISQQVAKNLFLWPGRSWLRKGLEAWFTVLIEWAWPKHRILETYLNVAEFGPGVYGVQSAARLNFGKDAKSLNASEAALLAAVLPNPRLLRVSSPSRYVLTRRAEIVGQMRALGGARWLQTVLPNPQSARKR